jgi:branched-chain amino acid transport system permease protein
MDFLINQTFNGISYGGLLLLLAGGFTILFAMNIINIAHGSFYLVAGYVGYEVVKLTGNYFLGIILAGFIVGFLGLVIEPIFLRRLEAREPGNDLRQMLVTIGITILIQDICLLIWGGETYMTKCPDFLRGSIQVGKFFFPRLRLFIIVYAITIFSLMWWFYEKTLLGARLRATSDNDMMASGVGIRVSLVRMGAFTMGAVLCGFGGVIGCSFMGIFPGIEFEIIPLAFVIAIVGGMGSLKGAFVASFLIGIMDNFGKALFPELSYFTLFAPLLIILAFKPTGLFGKG